MTLILLIITVNCGQKNDIKIYTVVPPEPLPFDPGKYSLIDTAKSFEELSVQASKTADHNESMQIFDYLLVHGPAYFGQNALAGFFKHFDESDRKSLRRTRELDLIDAALSQDTYTAIKEICLFHMMNYQIRNTQLDSIIFYMDTLHTLYPTSKLFDKRRYNNVTLARNAMTDIDKDTTLSEPDRLWRTGYVYWKLGTTEWKTDIWRFQTKAKEYFTELEKKYPSSGFNANAVYAVVRYEYGRAHEGIADTTCGLALKNKFDNLLQKYPETTARHEIFLYNTGHYVCIAQRNHDPDTINKYLHIADSIFSLVDPEKLFDDEQRRSYDRMESRLVRHLREHGQWNVDFHGRLYTLLFYGETDAPIDTTGLPSIVKRKIRIFLKRYNDFKSRMAKPQDLSFPHDVLHNNRINIERAIVSLIDADDINDLAAEYVTEALLYYEWEGMSDGPYKEGRHAEKYLNVDNETSLKPYLFLFIAHRYRCAYECIAESNEDERKKYTKLRYGYYLAATKNAPNLLVNLVAEDMERERYLYIPDSERP